MFYHSGDSRARTELEFYPRNLCWVLCVYTDGTHNNVVYVIITLNKIKLMFTLDKKINKSKYVVLKIHNSTKHILNGSLSNNIMWKTKNATTWREEWETALIIIIYMPRVAYGVPCVGKGRVCVTKSLYGRARASPMIYTYAFGGCALWGN